MVQIGKLVEKYSTEEIKIHWIIKKFISMQCRKNYILSPNFKFLQKIFFLQIEQTENCYHIYLHFDVNHSCRSSYNLKCTLGVKKAHGSSGGMKILEHTFSAENRILQVKEVFTRSALQEQESELMPLNTLTIVCKLERIKDSLNLRKFSSLSDNLKSLFVNQCGCDATLYVKGKEYKAHRAILMARSPVFSAMFLHDTLEKRTGEVKITDCDGESFEKFLEYLYSGELNKPSYRTALSLYETANKYHVEELKSFCKQYLLKNISVQNVCDFAILADKCIEENLMSTAQEFFVENMDEILDTAGWDSLVENNYCLSKKLLKGLSSRIKTLRKAQTLELFV